jgi:hypothetical protein
MNKTAANTTASRARTERLKLAADAAQRSFDSGAGGIELPLHPQARALNCGFMAISV